METKLKINIGPHHLEIEGPEAFVKEAYSEFKELVAQAAFPPQPSRGRIRGRVEDGLDENHPAKKAKGQKPARARKTLERIDIDLRPKGKVSFKDSVAQYASPTKEEIKLLSIAYLADELGIKDITVDHVYTCLDELGERVPTHLKQVLINLKNDKGWIDTSDFNNLRLTIKGRNHLKLDMKKA
jgi:hypothetical protein